MPENDLKTLMAFFEKDSEKLAKGEFIEFWKALTDEEKKEFKQADLK